MPKMIQRTFRLPAHQDRFIEQVANYLGLSEASYFRHAAMRAALQDHITFMIPIKPPLDLEPEPEGDPTPFTEEDEKDDAPRG